MESKLWSEYLERWICHELGDTRRKETGLQGKVHKEVKCCFILPPPPQHPIPLQTILLLPLANPTAKGRDSSYQVFRARVEITW